MSRALVAGLFGVIAALAGGLPALADDRDSARLDVQSLRIGEQATLTLEVYTAPDATVEIDPAADSWSGLEVVRLESALTTGVAGESVHRLEVVVAPFEPGLREVVPVVNVIRGADVEPRALPAVQVDVRTSLAPDAALELSELRPPVAIAGDESPLLRPAIAVGAVCAVLILAALGVLLMRRVMRRTPVPEEVPDEVIEVPSLEGAARLIDTDPVRAYRTLAATVRNVLGARYGFPASALTTAELQQRMESHGVDRWQARLAVGLLEECDAVIYAGYRPASERRHHDLTMAREIVLASPAAPEDVLEAV